jgi:hypothetical protein
MKESIRRILWKSMAPTLALPRFTRPAARLYGTEAFLIWAVQAAIRASKSVLSLLQASAAIAGLARKARKGRASNERIEIPFAIESVIKAHPAVKMEGDVAIGVTAER